MAAARKPRERNSRTSISGRATRRLCQANSPTSANPARIGAKAIGRPIPPWPSISERPKTMPARPWAQQCRAKPVEGPGVGAAGVRLE